MSDRRLDYCEVRSICGRDIADEMFGRRLPAGFDLDQPGDEVMVSAIVREESRCDTCQNRRCCFT